MPLRFRRGVSPAPRLPLVAIAILALLVAGCSPVIPVPASGSGSVLVAAGSAASPSSAAATATASTAPSSVPASTAVTSASPLATPAGTSGDADDEDGVPTASGTVAGTREPGLANATGIPVAAGPGDAALRLPGEPDPLLTPGALNPAVTQATIHTTICVSGWTATIRPPTAYTNALKAQQIATYGYANPNPALYEEDHLVSLQLGGAPTDARNLWPQPYAMALADGRSTGARVKDAFETALKKQVCAGKLTLAAAQARIGIHWVHFDLGIPLPPTP